MYGRRRRDGLREFMEGFNSTYETTGKVLRNMEMAKVMKEAPTEYQQYTPEQIAQIEEAAKNGTLETGDNGTYKGFEPAAKRYSMTGYDGDKMPTERELLGLRTSRMADVEAKYGNVAESLRLRSSADDMQWRNEQRDRAKLEQGRADEEYGRKEAARTELANVDGYTNAAAQQGIEEILANPNLPEEAKAPYRQWAGKTMKQGLSEAAGRLRSAGNIEGGDAALERAMKLEKEGVPRLLEAVKRGARGKELIDTFNSTGIFRAKDIQVKEVKDKYGNPDYIITGDINGRQGQLRASELEAQLMTPEQRIAIAQRDQGLAIQREGVAATRALRTQAAEDAKIRRDVEFRDKLIAKRDDYLSSHPVLFGENGIDKKREAKFKTFMNDEHNNRVNIGTKEKPVIVGLDEVFARDPNMGRKLVDQAATRFALQEVLEAKNGGKRLPPIGDVTRRDMESKDWKLGGGLGKLGYLDANSNQLRRLNPFSSSGGEVLDLGNGAVIDLQDALSGEYGEFIRQYAGENFSRTGRKQARETDDSNLSRAGEVTDEAWKYVTPEMQAEAFRARNAGALPRPGLRDALRREPK